MKKVYISPAIEIVASRLNQQVMQGHSFDWADAKGDPMGGGGGGGMVITNGQMEGSSPNIWED
ncbi:MAG: hypothetical protein K6C10_03875 [Prevotella sp.]|nr:hypothetical protein [Prevotella sp.]